MRFIVILLLCTNMLHGQIDFEKEYENQYATNIQKEYINDVYIPADLNEAFEELKRLSNEEGLQKFKNAEEEVVSRKLHFGLGRWIAFKWNFEAGSRLSHTMKEIGVTFPDDMVQMTIVSFHRHLNGIPLDIEGQAKYYYEKRKKENEERKKRAKEVIVKNN